MPKTNSGFNASQSETPQSLTDWLEDQKFMTCFHVTLPFHFSRTWLKMWLTVLIGCWMSLGVLTSATAVNERPILGELSLSNVKVHRNLFITWLFFM